MKLGLCIIAASLIVGVASLTLKPSSFSGLTDKSYGLISFKNHFHSPLDHGDVIPLECGSLRAGTLDPNSGFRYSSNAGKSVDLKSLSTGLATVHRTPTSICLTTNSTDTCVVRSFVGYNETWATHYASYPTGSEIFEPCFDKGVIAFRKGNKVCLDLRVAGLCTLRDDRCMGMIEGNFCQSAWVCDADDLKTEDEGDLKKQWNR